MFSFTRNSLLLLVALILSGCLGERVQPLHNAVAVTIPKKLQNAPISEIEDAILRAGVEKGWTMERVNPGTIDATLKIRNHRAEVNIFYSTTAYSITYTDSTNLLYSPRGIHRNYNSWIIGLEGEIDKNLSQIKANPDWQANESVAEAKSAWLAIENSGDPDQFSSFLKIYGDSEYAPKATSKLNNLLGNKSDKQFGEFLGDWKVNVYYTSIKGTGANCARKRSWHFTQKISSNKTRKTVWDRETAVYLETEFFKNTIYVDFIIPDGGSKWNWDRPLFLDQENVTFNAVAVTGGGSYSNCLGQIKVTMKKEP